MAAIRILSLGMILWGMASSLVMAQSATYYLKPDTTHYNGVLATTEGDIQSSGSYDFNLSYVEGLAAATGTVTISGLSSESGSAGASYQAYRTSLGRSLGDDYTVVWKEGANWTSQNVIHFGKDGKVDVSIADGSTVSSGSIYFAYAGNHTEDKTAIAPGTGIGSVTVGGNGNGTLTSTGTIFMGGMNFLEYRSGKSATLNVLSGGTVTANNGIWVGFMAGEGNLQVDGGALSTQNNLNIGWCDSNMGSNPYRSTGTVELKSGSVTAGAQVLIGTPVTRTVAGNGTGKLILSGGTLSAKEGIFIFESGTLSISGGTINGSIYLRPGGTVQWGRTGEFTLNSSPLTSFENAGTAEITNHRARLRFSPGSHIKIAKLNGEAYLDGNSTNRSHGYLTSVNTGNQLETDVTYGGFIDGYSWPILHANVGTSSAPVTIDWNVAGVATYAGRQAAWQYNTFYVGDSGNTGYVTVANGTLNGSTIQLGDSHAESSGTLEVKSGGKVGRHPHDNYSLNQTYTVNVGTLGGAGVLYLNGGALETMGTIRIGDNGTLKLGTDVQSAIPDGTTVSVAEGGRVEIVQGNWGLSLSRIQNKGTLHVNGGTIAGNYFVQIGGANSNCQIFHYTKGGLTNKPTLHSDGLLVMDVEGDFYEMRLTSDSTGGRVQIKNASSGLLVDGSKEAAYIVLEENKGELYFTGTMRGHTSFVKTRGDGVEYSGAIDGNYWPTGDVNVGTAENPVVLSSAQISNRNEYRMKKLAIGENGATGYAEFVGGVLRPASDRNGGGIILGDSNAASDGTLALTGGVILGHFNSGDGTDYNLHGDILAGALGGTGRLILAGGKMNDSRLHVTIGTKGTLEIANGAYTWSDLRLTNYDGTEKSMDGALEVTGGSLDLQGHSATFSKLNGESQYNTASAKGALTNSSATPSTVILNEATAGAYRDYQIQGNVGVTFGEKGLVDTIYASEGTIRTDQPLTILSDTVLEESYVDVARLNLSSGSLSVFWDDFFADSLNVEADGSLLTTFDLENSLPKSFDNVNMAGTLTVEWDGDWDGSMGYFFTIFSSEDMIDWLGNVNVPDGFVALMQENALVLGHRSAVPEPSTWLMLALGGGILWGWKRKCLFPA